MSTTKPNSDPQAARPMVEPSPPFPKQHQQPPGVQADLDPAPRWKGERYRPARKLEGLTAIVTGGDSGIGRAVAYHFAREGADVAITCLPDEKEDARTTREAIKAIGRQCRVYCGDLTNAEFCDNVVDRALDDFGRVNILVSNAAWQNRKPIAELDDDELDRTLKTNVYACLRLARRVVPRMEAGSSIIITGSIVGLQGADELGDYGATKGALHAITKCLAKELTDKQIRVNCVAPGPVWTPLNPADTGLTEDEVSKFGKETGKSAMGRPAQPEELAPAYVFLASNADSSYITGAVLPVTGEPI